MDDLISRQDAIHLKVSHGLNDDGILYVPLVEVINHLKALQPAQQWIPVTEYTLPKEDEWVIGVVDDIHDGSDAPGMAIVKIKKGISKTKRDELRRQSDSRSLNFRECDEWGNNLVPYCWETQGAMTYFGQEIIKWMPRPEPWKGESDANNNSKN